MKNKPDFLVVGTAKSGTTSLFHYLNRHPDIFIPKIKECRFFSQLPNDFKGLGAEEFVNTGIREKRKYFNLYNKHNDKICGDISNDYLYYYERSIKNILKFLGDDVKIIIVLRNPIDRAYSNYLMSRREGWEDLTFKQAIESEKKRIKEGWAWPYHYVNVGMYYQQVKAYKENFKNVRVYLFDDIKNEKKLLSDIYKFLGVKYIDVNIKNKYNKSGIPRSELILNILKRDYFFKRLIRLFIPRKYRIFFVEKIKMINSKKVPIPVGIRSKLFSLFKDDLLKLDGIIDRDLSNWLQNYNDE